jgi:hypothetical protein
MTVEFKCYEIACDFRTRCLNDAIRHTQTHEVREGHGDGPQTHEVYVVVVDEGHR